MSVAYSLGWIQRLLWLLLEQTATHLLWNGTPVTIGSLEIDLIGGKVWATNVVIHTPKRDEWQWESPLICRIGRVYVEHNWISSFLAMIGRMLCGKPQKQILELYTVEMSDIQGFIERRQHVFNFYLMDKNFELPDPKKLLEEERQAREQQRKQQANNPGLDVEGLKEEALSEAVHDVIERVDQECAESSIRGNSTIATSLQETKEEECRPREDDIVAHRQAQQLVDDMFRAVKSFGRVAQKRGSLAGALVEQRAQLTSKLKQFKGTKNKSEAMQEGVKVIQRVGKAVAKKTKDLKTIAPKMPPRKKNKDAPVYVRVGRVIIEDARVFTRTNSIGGSHTGRKSAEESSSTNLKAAPTSPPTTTANNSLDDSYPEAKADKSIKGVGANEGASSKWNKPIGISEIVLRSSELCPPTSLVDENGLPAIYQPMDKVLDVILKRSLVGLAKHNTTRFLRTALGEFFELEYSSIFGDIDAVATDSQNNAAASMHGFPSSNPANDGTKTYQRTASSTLSEPILQ